MAGATSGKANTMITAQNNKSLFITNLLFDQLACDWRRVLHIAEHAASIRDKETLSQIGARLSTMPGVYSELGELVRALAMNGPSSRVLANAVFEGLAESQSQPIRSRAMLALGSNYLEAGDRTQALAFYQKAAQINTCPLNLFCSSLMTIAARSGGLDELNRLSGLARYIGRAYPAYQCEYLNSVAVGLHEAGHSEEAGKLIKLVITSPFVSAYPEWGETASEIEQSQSTRPQVTVPSMARVLEFRVDRAVQVRRVETVLWNPEINGSQLKRYADGGEQAIERTKR